MEGGLLKLRVTRAPSQDREYSVAEVATRQELTYGRFAGRIKFCAGSGMVISGSYESRVCQPKVVNFDWSPTADFHDYVIEWSPDGVEFFVDGAFTHRDVQSKLTSAQSLRMNAWPTNNQVTQFAGAFDPEAVPCEAQYDWVEVYDYAP